MKFLNCGKHQKIYYTNSNGYELFFFEHISSLAHSKKDTLTSFVHFKQV